MGGAPTARQLLLLVSSWVLPGSGHYLLGRRARALGFLLIVFASIWIGVELDGTLYRIQADRPLTVLATFASMGMGLPYFVLRFAFGYEGQVVSPGHEYGSAFLLTAGLMNLLLVLDVWDILRRRKE